MSEKSRAEKKEGSVQKGSSSPVLMFLEGKAAAAWASGAYGGVREHDQAARTLLAAFFNTPMKNYAGHRRSSVQGNSGREVSGGSA